MKIYDYFECRSHTWADTLEYFARICKEASGGNAVALFAKNLPLKRFNEAGRLVAFLQEAARPCILDMLTA